MSQVNRLFDKYVNEVAPALQKELGIGKMEIPRIEKITLNMGLGREAVANSQVIEKAVEQLSQIAGQKAVATTAKNSIATFKLREGQAIGAKVTMRGLRMYNFLDKLVSIVLPRTRDFQGISEKSFDKDGNYALGIKEQTLFPEVDVSKVDKIRGMQVVITIKSKEVEHSRKLLLALGLPLKDMGKVNG
jgi:large subunit ribosomal protein L5